MMSLLAVEDFNEGRHELVAFLARENARFPAECELGRVLDGLVVYDLLELLVDIGSRLLEILRRTVERSDVGCE